MKPDEPLLEMVLIGYAPKSYGPEVWTIEYRVQQEQVSTRGEYWQTILMLAPVYLMYRTYQVFLSRIDDQKRHFEETQRLHEQAVDALLQARRAEQALAEEKERLAVTLRSIADGVITTDLDGTILTINAVAESLTGWTHDEAVGKLISEVYKTFDPETREACDNSIAALTARIDKLGAGHFSIMVARDLFEHPIEDSAALLKHSDGRARWGAGVDTNIELASVKAVLSALNRS